MGNKPQYNKCVFYALNNEQIEDTYLEFRELIKDAKGCGLFSKVTETHIAEYIEFDKKRRGNKKENKSICNALIMYKEFNLLAKELKIK